MEQPGRPAPNKSLATNAQPPRNAQRPRPGRAGALKFAVTVGVAGFEPTASSSRTTRATGLRYTPQAGRWGGLFHFPIVAAEKSLRTRKFEGFIRAAALSSEWQDSNLRPPAPHAGAIPGYATPRWYWRDKGKWFFGLSASCGQIKFCKPARSATKRPRKSQ